jgi:hypothetical protein
MRSQPEDKVTDGIWDGTEGNYSKAGPANSQELAQVP